MKKINNQKKSILVILIGIVILFTFPLSRLFKNYPIGELKGIDNEDFSNITVAACPTFYYILDDLKKEGFSVKKTNSTKENFQAMQDGLADFSISGRGVLKGEKYFPSLIIGPGYVFLFYEEFILLKEDMNKFMFFTDLSSTEIIEEFEHISSSNIREVKQVEDYLKKGVVITSPENEEKGSLVHVIQENEERVRLSRVPRLYYSISRTKEEADFIKKIIKE